MGHVCKPRSNPKFDQWPPRTEREINNINYDYYIVLLSGFAISPLLGPFFMNSAPPGSRPDGLLRRSNAKIVACIALEAPFLGLLLSTTMTKAAKRGTAPMDVEKTPAIEVPLEHVQALEAAMEAKGDITEAEEVFHKRFGFPHISHLKRMIGRVWQRFLNGDITFKPSATPVRVKKISDADATLASSYFLEGVEGLSGWHPFVNAAEVGT